MTSTPTLPVRAAQKLDTRERLLRAAQRLFCDLGIDATTVDQIARDAATSRANFYLHFTGKQTLLILAGAVVPFGGYAVDRWIDNNNAALLRTEGAGRAS